MYFPFLKLDLQFASMFRTTLVQGGEATPLTHHLLIDILLHLTGLNPTIVVHNLDNRPLPLAAGTLPSFPDQCEGLWQLNKSRNHN